MYHYELSLADDKIWHVDKLVSFLSSHKGKQIILNVNPEAHDLDTCGVYRLLDCFEFESVELITSNALETHDRYKITYRPVDYFLDKKYWQGYDLSASGHWNGSKIFGTFYGRPSANRIGIASYLFRHHREKTSLVFAADHRDLDQQYLFELDKLLQYRPESIIDFSHIIEQGFSNNLEYTGLGHLYNPNNPLHALYADILVDIISEPNIYGRTFYPTEKFSRCVLMKKPFIAMAPENYLEYLRQMGFKTFYDFWNEDYDGYAEKLRFEKILALIDTIAKKSPRELFDLYDAMQNILDHNYDLLTSQKYSTKIRAIT